MGVISAVAHQPATTTMAFFLFICSRVSPTYSQSTRRALEAPSLQEPLALVRAPVCLTATTGRVNTAIGSVAATAGQCRRSEAAVFAASSLTFGMETDKSSSPNKTVLFRGLMQKKNKKGEVKGKKQM